MNWSRLPILAMSLALGACAATPVPRPMPASGVDGVGPAHCLTHTGTRLLRNGRCLPHPGRAFTRADLERTGATTPAEAVSRLLP